MLPTSIAGFILSIASLFHYDLPDYEPSPLSSHTPNTLDLELRHIHAISSSGQIIFADVPGATTESSQPHSSYTLKTRPIKSYKPISLTAFRDARTRSMRHGRREDLPWHEDEIIGPDVESRTTLLELAKMTNNAYMCPNDTEWYDLDQRWNVSYPFGWEPDDDGFRGHVFATPDNSTVVLSIKGTSTSIGGGGPTTRKDKLNDNLLFSCCCARIDWTWTTVCDCYRGGWQCHLDCVEEALIEESLFYPIGTNLYSNLTYLYPDSNIWVTGHSLGGALASLIGLSFGLPVVAFEAPGERMAARRLHLPSPHITHVFHTADPIAMGTCNGVLSSCALGGYAMESRCHLGQRIIYDTVSNLSWSVDIRSHTIRNVIERILNDTWEPSEQLGREVPEAVPEEDDCVECYSWDFGDYPAA